eukprot:TRINITY_DN2706_c0_g3_i1.p1 TRINITY_DN2706_c0_g3~~TRINITY_DN2706_c0_g3_i1.p1  ORF type:complete len:479 (-),score=53.08 TRINITY_DN2706_c0_g3_i1:195-1631(-)
MRYRSSDVRGSQCLVSPCLFLKCTRAAVRQRLGTAQSFLTSIFAAQLLSQQLVRGVRVSDLLEQAAVDDATRGQSIQESGAVLTRKTATLHGELAKLRRKGCEHGDEAVVKDGRQETWEGTKTTPSTTMPATMKTTPMISRELRALLSETMKTQHERMLNMRNEKKLNVSKGDLGLAPPCQAGRDYSENFRTSGLVFLRIQKTGTTNFANTAIAQCSHLRVMRCDIYYHLDWNLVHNLVQLDPKRVIVTMLRNPVARVVSELTFLRKHGTYAQQIQWDYTPDMLAKLLAWGSRNGSFAEFVNLPGNPANNREVRYLLGFERPASLGCNSKCEPRWDEFLSLGGIDPGRVIDDAIQNSGANILDVAKHRLEHDIHFFGLTECYESSLMIANHALQWDPSITETFSNKKPRSSGADYQDITSDEATVIMKRNVFDMALLIFAKRLLAKRALAFGVKFECEVQPYAQAFETVDEDSLSPPP